MTNSVHYHTRQIDGIEIFYREAGPSDAPTLLLLHGFPSSSFMFRDLMPRLADHVHLIAPDLPGFGFSATPAPTDFTYTFDGLTTIMEHFLADLGVQRYSLYLHDYGGPIAMRLAVRQPERIDALIIQNANAYEEGLSAAFEPFKPFWKKRTPETEQAARQLLAAETIKLFYTGGVRQADAIDPVGATLDILNMGRPGMDAIQLSLLQDYVNNLASYPTWHAYLRANQPPTLIVWGKNDPFFTVEGALAYLRDVPQAEVHLYDTGHFALEERSEPIADEIRRFLHRS